MSSYRVRVCRSEGTFEQDVCRAAFISLHGITKRRLETIKKSLLKTDLPPEDRRGPHENRPRKVPDDAMNNIEAHIKSFKGRESHYSLKKTHEVYLSKDLNVQKMHNLYLAHP